MTGIMFQDHVSCDFMGLDARDRDRGRDLLLHTVGNPGAACRAANLSKQTYWMWFPRLLEDVAVCEPLALAAGSCLPCMTSYDFVGQKLAASAKGPRIAEA